MKEVYNAFQDKYKILGGRDNCTSRSKEEILLSFRKKNSNFKFLVLRSFKVECRLVGIVG